jgi:hypothetical protein
MCLMARGGPDPLKHSLLIVTALHRGGQAASWPSLACAPYMLRGLGSMANFWCLGVLDDEMERIVFHTSQNCHED